MVLTMRAIKLQLQEQWVYTNEPFGLWSTQYRTNQNKEKAEWSPTRPKLHYSSKILCFIRGLGEPEQLSYVIDVIIVVDQSLSEMKGFFFPGHMIR